MSVEFKMLEDFCSRLDAIGEAMDRLNFGNAADLVKKAIMEYTLQANIMDGELHALASSLDSGETVSIDLDEIAERKYLEQQQRKGKETK